MANIKNQGGLSETALSNRDKEDLGGGGGVTGPQGAASPGGEERV